MDFVQYSLSARNYILQPTQVESNLGTEQQLKRRLLAESAPGLYTGSTSSLQRFLPSVPKIVVEPPETMSIKPYASLRSLK